MTSWGQARPGFWPRLGYALEELWVALFAWIPTPIGAVLRWLAWRWLFEFCGKVRFDRTLTLAAMRNISLADGVRIGRGCFLTAHRGRLQLGRFASVSPSVHLGADDGEIVIGEFVAIGPGCVLRAANHCFASLDEPIMRQGHTPGRIVVEDDVWLGANVVITPDVRIGRGAIVGAGAVVTRDVPPFAIVGGVPAAVIGNRKKQGESDAG